MVTSVSSRFPKEASDSASPELYQPTNRVRTTIQQVHFSFYLTCFQKENSSFYREENSR